MRKILTASALLISLSGMSEAQKKPAAAPAKTPTAPSSAQASFRAITVTTQPGASVWIDGVLYGKASKDSGTLQIKTIASGGHTIRVRLSGYKERTQPLTALQKGTVDVPLVKTTDEAELAFQEAGRLALLDREKAVEAYQRAIKLRPSFADAYLEMARVLLEAGDLDEAQAAIANARRIRPGFAEASAVEGRILKEKGEEAKALGAFKRSITEGKGFQPEAYAGLGIFYKEKAEESGGSGDFANETANYNEAAKYLKTALKQLSGAPDASVIYQLLGLIYERQKRYNDAIALYEEFLRIFPDSSDATAVRSFIVQIKKNMQQP